MPRTPGLRGCQWTRSRMSRQPPPNAMAVVGRSTGQTRGVSTVGWLVIALEGAALIVWGAETFAKHLAVASTRLLVSAFALALLLDGAEPKSWPPR